MKKILFFVIFFSFIHLFGADELSIILSDDSYHPDGYLELWLDSIYPENSESFGENSQGMNYFNEDYWVLSREFDVKLMNNPNSFAYDVETSLKDEHVMEQLFDIGYKVPVVEKDGTSYDCYDGNYNCYRILGDGESHFCEITSDGNSAYVSFYYHVTWIRVINGVEVLDGINKSKINVFLKISYKSGELYVEDYAAGSETSLFYNPLDGLMYQGGNCVSNSYIDLKGFSTDFNKSSSVPSRVRRIRLNYGVNENCSKKNCFQGGAFSPNGRYFIKVADTYSLDDEQDHSGLYIFEIDEKHMDPNHEKYFRKLSSTDDIVDYNFVQFINFRYDGMEDPVLNSFGEMEGMDIFPTDERGDIHGLYVHNEGEDDTSIYHITSEADSDSDGIKDIYDNCPYHWNNTQRDRDNNHVGDVCDDYDMDGVFDSDDNCPDTPNPDQNDWNNDDDGDICDDSSGDGWMDNMSACPNVNMKQYFSKEMMHAFENERIDVRSLSCRNSVDWNCVESRAKSDLCDMDGDGRWDLEPEDEYEIDEYAYSSSGSWSKKGDGNPKITGGSSGTYGGVWFGTQVSGRTLSITQRASYFCGQESGSSVVSTYFCYCGKNDLAHFECSDEGDCGTDHANPGEAWDERAILSPDGQSTWQPVFSDFPNVSPGKKEDCVEKGNYIKKKGIVEYDEWDYSNNNFLKEVLTEEDLEFKDNPDELRGNGNFPMLKLAQGVVVRNSFFNMVFNRYVNYINTTSGGGHEVNTNYFRNYNQNHVKGEAENGRLKLARKNLEFVDLIVESMPYVKVIIIPGYGKWWYNMMRDFIGYNPLDDLGQRELGFQDIVKDSVYESISRPSIFSRVSFDGDEINMKEVSFNGNYDQMFAFGGRNVAYYEKDGEYSLVFTDVNGTFNDVNSVTRGVGMRSAAVAVSGTEIFMAAGYNSNSMQTKSLESIETDSAERQPLRNSSFVKISFDDNEAYMVELASLPWVPVNVSLFAVEGRIYAIMTDENGQGQILTYYSENNDWEPLTDFDFGKAFSLNNTFVKGQELYFTAPGPNDQNTLYTWSDGNGINEVASLDINYDAFIKPLNSGDRIILADFKNISEGIKTWELTDGEFTPVTIEIDRPEYDRSFCIREKDDSIFPGATNHKGECISVYDYNYDTVSYFDYKRTVAGKDNNLYLGGLSGVRRVEIKADGTLKNRELVTTGEIHNLARYENTLYGANGGEIEIFSIAENGSITEVADFDASACTNIRINDGILFTAEKKKVKVYDLTDPTSPQLIKTISTSGKVIDLEVIGKKLYIYEETTSWFTTKGYTGIYDISDISSPVRTGYFKKRCNDAEMQRSGETIHLGCKNGQYRVEETGLVEVSGEKNYVREGYVYDGILYQVFSGALHKSKTTGIEIVCGNGIVEPGEICDSDTLNCSELDVDYIDGTATCNSTCSGYNEGNCESDGW